MTVDTNKITLEKDDDGDWIITLPHKSETPPSLILSEEALEGKISGVENQISLAQERLVELQSWKAKVESLKT